MKSFVNDSKSNKLLELMLVQDETHPRLATRAYECYEWLQSAQYAGIINGTFTLRDKEKETAQETAEEVVSADAKVEASGIDHLNTELARVNQELERYTNHADKADYALAVASGVLSGLVDSLFVGEFSLNYANQWGNQQAENLVLPLLFIGIAAASGMLGIGSTVKAGLDTKSANRINKNANELVQQSTDHLNAQRLACGNALTRLGAEKLSVLNGTLPAFLDVFTQIKNVDFRETEGLDELHRLHIDEPEFVELCGMANFAGSIAGGAVAGTASGALAAFGRVDVLVNNAGVAPKVRADLLDMSEESFDYVVGINTKGNMFLTQLVAKQMISQEPVDGRKGVIVNVSSCSSVVSSTNRGEYCVSKAGISMLTTLYADRLAAEGILVNEVRPGVIATDMTSTVQGKYDALIEKGTFPIARWGTPEDVAGAVSLLCSPRLRYTTGNYIDVDGGFHIQRL